MKTIRVSITAQEQRVLLAVLHGAQDDLDETEDGQAKVLGTLIDKIRKARAA